MDDSLIEETGERSELICEAGKAYWYPAEPPGLHADVNETDEPVEVMLIEIKQD